MNPVFGYFYYDYWWWEIFKTFLKFFFFIIINSKNVFCYLVGKLLSVRVEKWELFFNKN